MAYPGRTEGATAAGVTVPPTATSFSRSRDGGQQVSPLPLPSPKPAGLWSRSGRRSLPPSDAATPR